MAEHFRPTFLRPEKYRGQPADVIESTDPPWLELRL